MIYRFDNFEVDSRRFTLMRAGQPVAIEPRALEMLLYLVERPQALVTRAELVANVWKVRFVGKGLVSQYAYALRRALDDDPAEPRLLETVRGRGYRFLANVVRVDDERAASAAVQTEVDRPSSGQGNRVRLMIVSAVVVVAVAGAVSLRRTGAAKGGESVAVLPLVNASGDAKLDWVELGLADMVARTLQREQGLDVVPMANVAALVRRASSPAAGDAAARRLLRGLGARWMVSGSLSHEGGLYWVRGGLHEADTDAVFPLMASGASPLAAADGLARAISQRLGGGREVPRTPPRIPPEDEETRRAWGQGMHAQLAGNAREASRWFEVCLARRPELNWARYELAVAKRKLGEREEARRLSEQVLAAAEAEGDAELAAAARSHLGVLAWATGDFDRAVRYLEESLATHRQLGRRRAEAANLVNLGIIATRQGRFDAAGALHQQALKLFEELGDERGQAAACNSLGVLAWNRGDLQASAAMHRRALEFRRSLGDGAGEAASLNNLGTIALARGEIEEAEALFSQALSLRQALADREGIASCQANLADVAIEMGRLCAAEKSLEQVRELAEKIPSPEKLSTALAGLGRVAVLRGDWRKAASLARERLVLERSKGGPIGQASALAALVVAEVRGGDPQAARAAAAELNALAGASDKAAVAMARSSARAVLAAASGNVAVAEHEWRSALEIARETGHGRWQVDVVLQLGELLLEHGRGGEVERLIAALPPAWRAAPRLMPLTFRLLRARGDVRAAEAVAARGRAEAPELWAGLLSASPVPPGVH